jgi:hypothetical protein
MQYDHSIFKPICTLFNTRNTHYSQGEGSITRTANMYYKEAKSPQEWHIWSHIYMPKSKFKITSKFPKVLRKESEPKVGNVTHNLEVDFSMNSHSKS